MRRIVREIARTPDTDTRSWRGTAAAPPIARTPCWSRRPWPSHPPAAGSRASSPAGAAASSRAGKQQPQLVARAHDHQPVVGVREERAHVAVARVDARRRIPHRDRHPGLVVERLGLLALPDRSPASRSRGSADRRTPASTGVSRTSGAPALSLRKISSQYTQRLVTMRTSRDGRKKLARQIDRDRLRLAGRNAHVLDDGLPLAAARPSPAGTAGSDRSSIPATRAGTCCRRPNPPSRSESARRGSSRRRLAEIEIEMMQLGDAGVVAPEAVGIDAVALQQPRQNVAACRIVRARPDRSAGPHRTAGTPGTAAT